MSDEMTITPQKFMFEKSFDEKSEIIDPLTELKNKFDEKIEKAKTEAFAQGRKQGEADARNSIENKTQQTLEKIVKQQEQLLAKCAEEINKQEAQSIEFGITAGTTLANELIRREPLPMIENFFKEAFQIVHGVPEITIRLNPKMAELTRNASEKWKAEAAYEGNLNIIDDESLKEPDVSITWKDGGISQSIDSLMDAIRSALATFFKSKNIPEAPSIAAAPASATGNASQPIEAINKSEPSS